jgi:serine/threonine-protein kinase
MVAGRYRLCGRLGRGGMATVYRADDLHTGQAVAVKLLDAELAADPTVRARFAREAALATALGGAHVAAVLAVGGLGAGLSLDVAGPVAHPRAGGALDAASAQARSLAAGGPPFLVMELVEGPDLAGLLRAEGSLSAPRAVRLISQVLAALEAVHAAGVVHRDLKPENVLVARAGTDAELAKLCDFGIATLRAAPPYDDLTPAGRSMATPHYATPEQLRGDRGRGPTVDVYAAAVVLYELLAGARPFEADSFLALCERIRDEPPAPLRVFRADVPEDLDAVVLRALSKRPADRHGSARELREALLRAVAPARP